MKLFLSLICLMFIISGNFAQNQEPFLVLKGFDAVALAQGKQIKGKQDFFINRGRFKYLFANPANKKKFEANPELYEVQNKGEYTAQPLIFLVSTMDREFQGLGKGEKVR